MTAVCGFQTQVANIRTGRATVGLLDVVTVDYYGTPTPLSQMASVAVPNADDDRAAWDQTQLGATEKSILAANSVSRPRTTARSFAYTVALNENAAGSSPNSPRNRENTASPCATSDIIPTISSKTPQRQAISEDDERGDRRRPKSPTPTCQDRRTRQNKEMNHECIGLFSCMDQPMLV